MERFTRPMVLLVVVAAVFVWSGIGPYDRLTWLLEVAPVLIGVPVLLLTNARFPLTRLVQVLLAVHAVILMVGGHFTYALVPAGEWIADLLGLARNHYDRLGHVAQGFVPAMLAREILLRCTPLQRGRWLYWLVVSICLAFSAFYEMLEWWAAVLGGDSAESFLGTQGDIWDTQWDMFLALLGAMTAQLLLSRLHDRQLTALLQGRAQ